MAKPLVVRDLFLLCCMMQRTQEQITFLAGVKGAKMIPRDLKTQKRNPARLVGGFIFIDFYTAGASFWWGPRVPK